MVISTRPRATSIESFGSERTCCEHQSPTERLFSSTDPRYKDAKSEPFPIEATLSTLTTHEEAELMNTFPADAAIIPNNILSVLEHTFTFYDVLRDVQAYLALAFDWKTDSLYHLAISTYEVWNS